MKCQEVFYKKEQAVDFLVSLKYDGADAELVEMMDEDADEMAYIVYFNPPRYK